MKPQQKICPSCRLENGHQAKYCQYCGSVLAGDSSVRSGHVIHAENPTQNPTKPFSAAPRVIVALLALLIVVPLGIVFANHKPSNSANSTGEDYSVQMPTDLMSEDEVSALTKTFCQDVEDAISSNLNVPKYLKKVDLFTASAKKAAKDPWSAASWKEQHPTLFTGDYAGTLVVNEVTNTIGIALDNLTLSSLGPGVKEAYESNRVVWLRDLEERTVSACGLSKTLSKLEKFDQILRFIYTESSNLPWYPKGFEVIKAFPEFAYDAGGAGCSYSFGSCATFRIVSQYDCPSNLYVEANLLSNDTVVDWGNDTARVNAEEVAQMEIPFTTDGDSWRFTNITCY